MKVLLLGAGLQGRAALHDLARSDTVTGITAADLDLAALEHHAAEQGYGDRVRCEGAEASDPRDLDRLLRRGPDVVVDLLPVPLHDAVTAAAVDRGAHVVNASYVSPAIRALGERAAKKGLIILPEFGMDPGIDLVFLGRAAAGLDRVDELVSYGAGFPEPSAADNPIRYKVGWSLEGVLRSYRRAGRVIREGKVVDIGAGEMFAPENIHQVEIEGLGRLEAFPNGDALPIAERLGLHAGGLARLGRFVLRWPGHADFWRRLVALHLLDDEPVEVDGRPVDRRRFLAAAMAPHLQYGDGERDVVVVRVEAAGMKDGRRVRTRIQLIDFRDLEMGLSAMSRTVGFTASIGAQMIGAGEITGRGLLSPLSDVPFDRLKKHLAERGIPVSEETAPAGG